MTTRKSSITILFASMVIVMIGFGIAIPLMPYYITHFQASGTALGLMMSLYSLMQFIFAPLWGQLSDRVGRKPVLLVGISGYFIAFVLQGLSQNLFQFIAARTLAGVLSSATLPTAMAFIADTTTPENRSKGVGMMGAAMGLGMIIGPVLGGLLTKIQLPLPSGLDALLQTTIDPSSGAPINLSIPFFASALLALIALPFAYILLPESLPLTMRGHALRANGSRLASLTAGLRGPIGFLFVMAFLLAFALANLESVLGLYGQSRFNLGPAEFGLLMGAMGVLSVIMQGVLIGPVTRRIGEENVLKSGLVVSMLGLVGLALAPTKALMIAAALVFSTGNVLLQPSVTALISRRSDPTQQGAAMGLNNSFQSLGRGTGPLWAGAAFDIHATLSFWSGALVQLIAFIFALRLLGSPRGANRAAVEAAPQPGGETSL
ncbi:MFS transporter [bacterium]|nr:MAG: MFS transporter [bacterium]